VHLPVLNDNDAAVKAKQKSFGQKQLQIIVACTHHSHYFPDICNEPIIIRSHGKVKVQIL
jgi:hypothetical protein